MSDNPVIRQRRKEARPSELLAAALDVFATKGFAAARLEEIASLAGVSKGTLYLYFSSKEALFKAVVQKALVPRIVEGEQYLQLHANDPEKMLRSLLLAWWEMIGNSKLAGIPRLIMAEAGNFPEVAEYYFLNVIDRGRALVVAAIKAGVEQGVFRPCDPVLVCHLAVAPLMSRCLWPQSIMRCDPQSVPNDVFVQGHLDMFMRGLLVDPGQQPSAVRGKE